TRSRLEQLQLPEPVLAVRLRASDLPSFTPKPVSLLEERPPPVQPWDQLRERLRARLGDEAIHGLVAVADHRPECARRRDPEGAGMPPVQLGKRPGWLLAEPEPLNGLVSEILAVPERGEAGRCVGDDRRRGYNVVGAQAGSLARVYLAVYARGSWMLDAWFACQAITPKCLDGAMASSRGALTV